MTEQHDETTVTLELEAGYRFRVDLGDPSFAPLLMDEPQPLGEGRGPNASRVLAAAVGNCLAASLLYCLRRARVEVETMRATVRVTTGRNARGRLRLTGLGVTLDPGLGGEASDLERARRCLGLFEDFCVVTESVRDGLPVDVRVVGIPEDGPAEASMPAEPERSAGT